MYLPDVISDIIQNKEGDYNHGYAQVGSLKIRNQGFKEMIMNAGLEDGIYGFNIFLDKEYKAVTTPHGIVRYYSMENELEEVTDPKVIEAIKERFESQLAQQTFYA